MRQCLSYWSALVADLDDFFWGAQCTASYRAAQLLLPMMPEGLHHGLDISGIRGMSA
jgi:hypothetical protein